MGGVPVTMWDRDHVMRVGQREYLLYLDKHVACANLRPYPLCLGVIMTDLLYVFLESFMKTWDF